MSGNPYAIFLQLINNVEYKNMHHYWVYEEEKQLEYDTFARYKTHPRVHLIKSGTKQYIKMLATAHYLINNAALPTFWAKREEQIYINTWHGTPLKMLGKDAKDSSVASITNAQRNFFMCDYMVMPNEYTINKMMQAYDLNKMMQGKIIDAGYPRIDLVSNTDSRRIRNILNKRVKTDLKNKKIILYAPTFRSGKGLSLDTSLQTKRYMKKLFEILPENYVLFFKVHNMVGKYFENDNSFAGHLIFDEIETNELLSAVDILITDYSSIFFDFLCTKRPILFFVYDHEEYNGGRGLYFPLEKLPGALCYTLKDIVDNLEYITDGDYSDAELYNKCLRKFAYNDDGNASQRIIDIIFQHKEDKYVRNLTINKKRVLVYSEPLRTNTNLRVCEHVLRGIDTSQYEVVLWGKNAIDYLKQWENISSEIKVIGINIQQIYTLGEYLRIRLAGDVREKFKKQFYKRQLNKHLGCNAFEHVIFCGDIYSWGAKMLSYIDADTKAAIIDSSCISLQDRKKIEERYEKIITMSHDDTADFSPSQIRESVHGKMTILFMATFDSMNYVFVNLILALKENGHRCIVVTRDVDDYMNNKMFIENNIAINSIKDISYDILTELDIAFVTPTIGGYNKLIKKIQTRNVFTISFANLFSSVVIRGYPDLVCSIGINKFQEMKENGLSYNMIAIGNPQYDSLIQKANKTKVSNEPIKKVLIIEQGGYPFGEKGKRILGQVFMSMAITHPEMEFIIKPRFLPDEKASLHAPSEHVYDFLEGKPDNLIPLTKATILEDIIEEYDAVITTWSTAYLEAAIMKKPLLLIEGLPSEDVFDVRSVRIRDAYEQLRKTGCVVHYTSILKGELKFRLVDDKYLSDEVYGADSSCCDRIIHLLEKIYEHFISKDLRYVDTFQISYSDMEETFQQLSVLPVRSKQYQLRNKYFILVNKKMQDLVYQNRCMGQVLDLKSLWKYWEVPLTGLSSKDYEKIQEQLDRDQKKLLDCYMKKNEKNISHPIMEYYYLEWLFLRRRYFKILNYTTESTCPEAVSFFKAMVYLRIKNYKKAADKYRLYYEQAKKRSVKIVRIDRNLDVKYISNKIQTYRFWELLLNTGEYELVANVSQFKKFSIDARSYYYMQALTGQKRYEEVIDYYKNYILETRKPGKKNRSNIKSKYYPKNKQLYNDIIKMK